MPLFKLSPPTCIVQQSWRRRGFTAPFWLHGTLPQTHTNPNNPTRQERLPPQSRSCDTWPLLSTARCLHRPLLRYMADDLWLFTVLVATGPRYMTTPGFGQGAARQGNLGLVWCNVARRHRAHSRGGQILNIIGRVYTCQHKRTNTDCHLHTG